MKITKSELLEMLKDFSDNEEIILRVRDNMTVDYSEQRIVVKELRSGRICIMDKLSE